MVAVTYGDARVAAHKVVKAAGAQAAAPRRSLFARFIDALIESRMRQARREIARHIHFLPYALDERGNRLVTTAKTEMPFGGW